MRPFLCIVHFIVFVIFATCTLSQIGQSFVASNDSDTLLHVKAALLFSGPSILTMLTANKLFEDDIELSKKNGNSR